MNCPRIEHFVRLNKDGTIGKCGHMNNHKGFESVEQLQESEWLQGIRDTFAKGEWPRECVRCQHTEEKHGHSIRLKSIDRHRILERKHKDYLVVGGVLDNICNSACQTCNSTLSTKIGSLETKSYKRVDNYVRFWELPQDRIVEVDVNGGEPTASKNYKKILVNLPKNTQIVRMNTNCSRTINELETILEKGIAVIVTMSLDGVGTVHDYVRWPIKWKDYTKTVDHYVELREKYKLLKLDFWTTVSCLNLADFENIKSYARQMNIAHGWAFLTDPAVYDVRHKNKFTLYALPTCDEDMKKNVGTNRHNNEALSQMLSRQDKLRGIDHRDYFNF
jgi:sulfatase maturation enzyme AslB (radical SAM superfamily)